MSRRPSGMTDYCMDRTGYVYRDHATDRHEHCHPVLVLDPEDSEAMQMFHDTLWSQSDKTGLERMTNAVRAMLTSLKVPESLPELQCLREGVHGKHYHTSMTHQWVCPGRKIVEPVIRSVRHGVIFQQIVGSECVESVCSCGAHITAYKETAAKAFARHVTAALAVGGEPDE